jgi:hypothetical protein
MRHIRRQCVRALAVVFALAGAASAQVVLTSPITAVIVGANIQLAGTGYPAGTIAPAQVNLIVTPSPGNGSPVSFCLSTACGGPSNGVVSGAGGNRTLIFKLPQSLTANQPYTATIAVSGQTTAAVPFSTTTPATVTINPPASLSNVAPGAGQLGTAVGVTITGKYTHFGQLTSVVTVSGTGVAVSNMQVVPAGSLTQLTATFTIAPGATIGPRTVTVTTGAEVAALPVGFVVTAAPGLPFSSINPNSAPEGTSLLAIDVQGVLTHFDQSTTTANFGDGITINSILVNTPTDMTVTISVDPLARTGGRIVTVVTGGEFALATNGFTVTSSAASIISALPAVPIPQGTNATLTLTGLGTHWVTSATNVSFGGGINTGNITVNSPTSLTVNLSVGPGVAAGSYGVTTTTNGEVATLGSAVGVSASTPFISNVNPTIGAQGQTLDVVVTGTFTNFLLGALSANFGSHITVNSVTPNTATQVTINVSIDFVAAVGGRSVTLTTNGTLFSFNFSVTPSGASITGVAPNSGLQQSSVALQVTGAGTHWVQGTTLATLNDIYITTNRVIVNSPTSAEVDVTLGATAALGLHSLTMSTGGEVVTAINVFTVLPFTPSLSLAPSSGMIGTTVNVNFNGNFTHFSNQTLANIDGQGVQIQNFAVVPASQTTATAQFVISPTAPSSPASPCPNRTVTLTTGNEIVTAPFCVTSTPAVLTSITPSHSPQNTSLIVTITGQNTNFTNIPGPNFTTVGFGPDIIRNGNPVILGKTLLTQSITIAPNAALGYRQAFVNTGAEQLSIGFLVDAPASASLVSVSPSSGQQGQTINNVTITGNLTNFVQGNTIAILGAGVTVSNLAIIASNQAQATVAISPTTQIGGRTVEMITGPEVVSGPLFTVNAGIATMTFTPKCGNANAVLEVACAPTLVSVQQGGIVPFSVTGANTNFLQGETTMTFGSGITVTQLVVNSPTSIDGQIAVSYTAPIGFHQVSVITDGEVAVANSDALNVLQTTSTSLNITPTSGQQGASHLQVQMNGSLTNWINGTTVATFGNNNGLVVNAVNVSSPTQAIIDLTIQGTTYQGPYSLTVTTNHGGGTIEQETLLNVFGVIPGAAIITNVAPVNGTQGSTENVTITGQNTSWLNGVTYAYFTTGGCIGSPNPGVNVANVTVNSTTSATLSVAISPTAQSGLQTLCMGTLGELVNFQNAFTITPGTPTLNGVTPVMSEQGTTASLNIIGQFTHWVQGTTTITLGQGITLTAPLTITGATGATANIAVDPLAYIGSRNVVLNTSGEIVQGTAFFTVTAGPAILSSISPSTGNQGTHILMQVNGQNTHWAQGLSQVTINGAGYDITINGVQVQSPTTLVVDLNLSPTANLGVRTIYVSTGGENVTLNNGFVVTGGIPSISGISPSSIQQGSSSVNVQISGIFTHWDNTTLVSFGPNITFTAPNWTVNSNSSITAIVNVPNGAPLGLQTVTVQTGAQVLTTSVNILSNAPPTSYISYEYPSVALVGQTLSVSLVGQYTRWLPGTTQVTFGAGIVVNNFQVTGLNSAIANITIVPGATLGSRTVTLTTGAEAENTTFIITVGTPAITVLSPGSIIQGQTIDVDIVGQYTTFDNTTIFNFGQGITLNTVTLFGPTAARVNISADIEASLGGRGVTATTGAQIAYNVVGFSVTPSQATITMVSPNTAKQGDAPVINVTGFATNWDNTTQFSLGGIGITSMVIHTATTATLTLSIPPLASVGEYSISAQTGGEHAFLNNAFVVTPGTPILISATGANVQQGMNFSTGILGQLTSFVNGVTAVNLGTGVNVTGVNVTSSNSITVTGNADPTAFVGGRNVTVTTGAQTLVLFGAFYVSPGTAQITLLNANSGNQGQTLINVAITGTNTHWVQGVTIGTFGQGISLNTLTINGFLSATANITIAANALVQQNSVTLTTLGESATDVNAFTIISSTPVIDFINPTTLSQGQSTTISLTGSFTNWVNGNTVADFGAGVNIGPTTITAPPNAGTAQITVSPIAAIGTRTVRMITNLGGGGQEIAIKSNAFTITAGTATISSIVPNSPATVHQNDSGDIVYVTGTGTHFTSAPLTNASVVFCGNVSTAAVQVISDTVLHVTVNVATFAPVGACGVTVTTGGEVATGGSFTILAGLPVITQVNPNVAQQGQTLNVNITGLYTKFTSGALTVAIPGGVLNGAVIANNDTSATANFTFGVNAATGLQNVSVSDAVDGPLTDNNAFTVNPGTPALMSVAPNTLGQGITQTIVLSGAFTHFSNASVITVSGTGVNVGAIINATPLSIQVPFTVTAGALATLRSVQVQSPVGAGTETVALNGFTVQPGVPNITQITPNIGVPNSTVPITFTGIFTTWVNLTTTARIGTATSGIHINGGAAGAPTLINVTGPTTATATLTIDLGATIQPNDVHIITGAQDLSVGGGFQVLASTITPPTVTFISPTNGAVNVPTNTSVSVTFSEPLNPATIPNTGTNAFITDATLGGSPWSVSGLPAIVGLDASGRILTITPQNPLAVGHLFYLQLNSYSVPGGTPTIADQSGNPLAHLYYSFTSGLAPNLSGPTFITSNIPAGALNVPTNVPTVTLGFNQPINPATQAAGLSITTGAVPVPGVWSYDSTFTEVIFTPSSAWSGVTTYKVTYGAQLQNAAGIALTNPGNFTFTTVAGVDNTSGAYITWTPPYPSPNPITTGTTPTIRFIYNKPVNPLTMTPANFYVYDTQNGITVLGSTISHSADLQTWTLNLASPLLPGTNYHWSLSGAQDWIGNGFSGSVNFTTALVQDVTAPFVSTISPSAAVSCGASPCAPVNSEIQIRFSELMDPTSLTAGAVTLTPTAPAGPPVTGTFSFSPDFACTTPGSSGSCDFTLLTFKPSANLAVNTTYQVSIPDGNLADTSGNFDPFTSSFTTSSSAAPDTTHGTISSVTPSNGATGVPLNTNVVVQLSKPVDPLTVTDITTRSYSLNSFVVYDQTGGVNVPGTVTVSLDLLTITFAQTLPFEPNHQICVYPSYWVYMYDLAGNSFNNGNSCFTTGAGTDITAPVVSMVTPFNNATGIGANNPVMVTFSKSINPGTLSNNVALFNGNTLYTPSYTLSGDGTTLTFSSGNLPFSTTYTVAISPNITDLAGNHLATQFSSTFTTMPQPVTAQPTVTAMRPGSGATGVGATTPVTFFMSAPMNPSSINPGTLVFSQNGVPIGGTVTVAATNRDLTFVPTGGSFAGGAIIQVFFTSGATDVSGNPLVNFQSSFTIAPDLTGVNPSISSRYPCYGCGADTTTVIENYFTKPMSLASATGSNFYVSASSSGTPVVAGAITLLDGGHLLRFKPSSPLSPNTYYYVFATQNLQDTSLLSFTGGNNSAYLYYFSTTAVANSAPPSVSATAPTNGSTFIGTNAVVSVTFSENVDQYTLDPSTITLTGPGGNIPLSIGYNSSTFTMTVTPQSPLPPVASITLTMNGVTDVDGDALNPTPWNNLTFTTGPAPDFNPPVFVTSNISSNQTNVPVTTSVSMTFNKPLDARSVILSNTVYFQDVTLGYTIVPAALSLNGSGTILIVPNAPLSVGHQYRAYVNGVADLNGNTSTTYQIYFTTVLSATAGGPVVTQITPLNGSSPPINFSPMVQFDRGVAPTSLAGVTLTQGGNPVAVTRQLSAGGTILTLVPNAILSPGLPYLFTVTGVKDSVGNTMVGSVTSFFTTGPTFELTGPVITLGSPVYNSTTGTNPAIFFAFNEQINPITSGAFTFYEVNVGGFVAGSTLSWAPDRKGVSVVYPGTLSPGSRYYFYLNSVCNLAGNCTGSAGEYFYTGSSSDHTPETITSVNPPNGTTTPTNPAIRLVFSKPVALGSLNASLGGGISPAPPAGTTYSLSSDGFTLTVSLGGNLTPLTLYTINIPAGAFTDQDGNPVAPFTSSFTTSASAELSTNHGTISMTVPAPGASGVALTSTITATFSQPLNPTNINANSFVLYQNDNGNYGIAGTITNPTPDTLVFTPSVALPPNTSIGVYVGYYSTINDYAGNSFSYITGGANAVFTTANTADNTPPQIISMSPGNGATNVGPYAPVSFTFNKSIDYTTITSANFAMYYGSTFVNPGITYSGDHRTVYLNATLPYSTSVVVAVNTGVKDYAGNFMANSYQASFTTQAAPVIAAPSVIQSRPGNGAALNSSVTLFMSAPMNLATVQAGMYVAQNGVLISGNPTLTADLRGIKWTPSSNYQAGATIEVYLTATATDTSGNPATAYKFTFTTASSQAGAPMEVSTYPSRYTTNIAFTNPVVEVQFSKPLNLATVTSATFVVTQGSGPGGTVIPGVLSLVNNNTEIRFTPTAAFPSLAYFYVQLTSGIQDMSANAFAGDGYYIYVNSSAPDNTPPTVSAVTPANGSTGVGDNAPVRLTFSKLMDTSSINSSTVSLLNGATPLPWTATFGTVLNLGTQTVATLMPQSPLPDNATITVQVGAGVTDLTGAAIAAQSPTFTTMAGADFTPPVVISQSIDNHNNLLIPTNSTFTFVFSKPLDPSSVIANTTGTNTSGFYIYDSANCGPACYPIISANVSADGRTVTIVPAANLTPNATNDYVYVYNATDLSGNPLTGTQQHFTTAATTNLTGPTIVATNPLSANPNPVPTNTSIEVIFSAPVSGASLGSVTLAGGANGPYTTVLDNSLYTDDTVIRIVPQTLLLPNTTYTVHVTGVKDVAGNAAGTTTFTFTTGPNYQGTGDTVASSTVTTGTGTLPMPDNTTVPNVLDSPTFTIGFDHAVDFASLLKTVDGISLRDASNNVVVIASLNVALSTDQKTATITTSAPLAPATTYHLWIAYWGQVYDIAGNTFSGSYQYLPFTTQ